MSLNLVILFIIKGKKVKVKA